MIKVGLFGVLAIGGAALIGAAAIAFVCDELSQSERRRQDRLRDEYNDYERRKRQEYRDTCSYYENVRNNTEIEYNRAIAEYHRELVKQRKQDNQKTFDTMINMYNEHLSEKKKLLDECRNIVSLCESSIGKQQSSYVRFKSIKSTLISLNEAVYKLEAYLRYMEKYKQRLDCAFETEGEIIEPFSLTLPKDYPYEGKLLFLKKNDFVNHGIELGDAGYVRIDQSDFELFDESERDSTIPFMVNIARNGKQYLSLTKGLLKNSIGGTIGIDAEVTKIFPKRIQLSFKGNLYPSLIIQKQDLISQHRKTPIGSNLHVYVKDYDFALKKAVFVSEKMSDGLTIAHFEYIALLQTKEERQELFNYLKKNDLLDEDDEWRIGPIMDDDKRLIGIIMQIGYSYAFKAYFENIVDGKLVLRYGGMIPKDDLISFDDVFVATNVTLDCYTPAQVLENHERYEDYFEECQKLQLYLINEFAIQSKMMINSPMSVYLNQWAEITNRLVDLLSYGANIKIPILEWKYFSIKNAGTYTILYIDKPEKIIQFVEKEKEKNRYKFFVEVPGEENTRFPCKLIEEEDSQILIRLNGRVEVETLIDSDFMLDMYSVSIPYAEKQHANAFSMFKEGRVVSENVKTAIINTSEVCYQDNGYRISNLFNPRIQTNINQLDAVTRAFGEEKFFLIQGPPGTGKTTVIKELILQQLRRSPTSRILVVSQANVAVDNVLRGIAEISKESGYIEESQIVRCGTIDKIASDIEEFSFDKKYKQYQYRLWNEIPCDKEVKELREKWLSIINNKNNHSMVGECLLSCYQIIGATCVGLESRHYGLNNMEFDLVIIDEAGKALAGELLIPINRARKVIIIGDHKQLPPVINTALYKGGKVEYGDVVEEEQQIDFLNRSFFQRLYEDCPDNLKCMLDVQFRMPPVIANLVNMFYDGELKTGENCFQKRQMLCGNHLVFIDMKNEPDYLENDRKDDGSNTSPFNVKEVEATVAIVTKIRKYYSGRIVVITPYKRQKYMLIKGFNEFGCKNIWVNTIDAFQGDEENVVIYCTTRANKPTRYFSDVARLNVAFSRAKNTLIFLGSSNYLKKYPKDHILRNVSDYLSNNARKIQYKEWLDDGFDLQYVPIDDETFDSNVAFDTVEHDLLSLTSRFFDNVSEQQPVKMNPKCQACGVELDDGENILCGNCVTRYEIHKCKCCGGKVYLSYYDKYIHGVSPSDLCDKCSIVTCSECKNEFYISNEYKNRIITQNKSLLCITCQEKYRQIAYRHYCDVCGEEITLSYAAKKKTLEQGKTLPTICCECHKKGNEIIQIGICNVCQKPITTKRYILEKYPHTVNSKMHKECSEKIYTRLTCAECSNTFSITYGEKQYFNSKGLSLPKRCKRCRKNRH